MENPKKGYVQLPPKYKDYILSLTDGVKRSWAGASYNDSDNAPFKVLANGQLIATGAYIKGTIITGNPDPTQSNSLKRIELSGLENKMTFYNDDNKAVLTIDDDMDYDRAGSPSAGLRASHHINGRVSFITGNGMFSNGSNVGFIPGTSGIESNASLVGLLFDKNNDTDGISAGVVGIDSSGSGSSQSYGGYFNSICVTGAVYMSKIRVFEGNAICNDTDYLIAVWGANNRYIQLPNYVKRGREIRISILGTNYASMQIRSGAGNGVIHAPNNSGNGTATININTAIRVFSLVFDGSNWIAF